MKLGMTYYSFLSDLRKEEMRRDARQWRASEAYRQPRRPGLLRRMLGRVRGDAER